MVNPENIHTSNIIQTEQVIFRNIYVYTYMCVMTINTKGSHEFERQPNRSIGGFRERKKKG